MDNYNLLYGFNMLPLTLSSLLNDNTEVMDYYNNMEDSDRTELIDYANGSRTKEDVESYINYLKR